jgi:hypothetical protein
MFNNIADDAGVFCYNIYMFEIISKEDSHG